MSQIASSGRNKGIDWLTLSLYLSLLVTGWLMLYSVEFHPDHPYAFLDFSTQIGKQTIWLGGAIILFIICLTIDWKFWNTFAYPIYVLSLLSLVAVLIFGSEIKGAKAWFSFSGFSIQPSEFTKFATAIALSSYISYYKSNVGSLRTLATSMTIIGIPVILIMMQPDAGSAITFTSFFLLLYRRGLSPIFYILGFSFIAIFVMSLIIGPVEVSILVLLVAFVILLFNSPMPMRHQLITLFGVSLVLFIVLHINPYYSLLIAGIVMFFFLFSQFRRRNFKLLILVSVATVLAVGFGFGSNYAFENILQPHQQDRINVWLRPELCDPRGSLYNIIQSKMAIGSGGFQGKGFLDGTMTKLNYVPEQTTDFIFSTVGEEQGFIGSLGIIVIFVVLMIRITVIAERAKSPFIQNYAYCVAGIIFIHFFINIAMTMGLMPVIGIPLPMLSKGGSSLLGFTFLIATLLKMDLSR
ncbi:MAG TPA: rod shape-determining protein RodA [Saprospiraceae bacterium]|nr:rod shape-determining protein RodA [Saprospiraceae bacterium]